MHRINFNKIKNMKKSIFGATLIAFTLLSGCGGDKSSGQEASKAKEISNLEKSKQEKLKKEKNIVSASQNNLLQEKSASNNTSKNNEKTEVMSLISGDMSDCVSILFKKSNGEEIYAGTIPSYINWIENEDGGSSIEESFYKKKYLVTYSMKRFFCESSGDNIGSLEMNVTKMEVVN